MSEAWFERLAGLTRDGDEAAEAPARLKSKVYSALIRRLAESGPLEDLAETKAAGGDLCVFEQIVAVLPAGAGLRSMNPCLVCHARVAGERMDHAPIFWPGCPYSRFHNP